MIQQFKLAMQLTIFGLAALAGHEIGIWVMNHWR